MPYAVRKAPASNDPRSWAFLWMGWQYGQVPPYKWRLSTTGALAPFEALNAGIVLPVATYSDHEYLATGTLSGSLNPTYALEIFTADEPQPFPSDWTVRFTFTAVADGINEQAGELKQLWPVAIAQRSIDDVLPVPSGTRYIPNPLIITPVRWDTPESA